MLRTRKYSRLPWGILTLAIFGAQELPGTEEPQELALLRQKYVARVDEAQKAVTKRYLLTLAGLQKTLNQSGRTDEALVVLQERKKLAALLLPVASPESRKEGVDEANPPQGDSASPGGYDPAGSTWSWRQPAKEITFLKNGRAYVLFPELAEKPLPHYWKKVGLREIEVRYENGTVILKFEVNKNEKTGIVKSGESNAVAEVFLIAAKAGQHN